MRGIVYSETTIWMAPANFTDEVPYQLAIADLDNGERQTVRIVGTAISIGDQIEFHEIRQGVSTFHKVTSENNA